MADMQTMPVDELVEGIRIKSQDMDPLHALVFNVLANRLEQQAELLGQTETRITEALRQEQEARRQLNKLTRDLMKAKRTIRDMEIERKRLRR